jgi:hypothetical protein
MYLERHVFVTNRKESGSDFELNEKNVIKSLMGKDVPFADGVEQTAEAVKWSLLSGYCV